MHERPLLKQQYLLQIEGSPALQIDSGKHVLVLNNVFSVTSRSREGRRIGLRGHGEGPGTALYTDDVTFWAIKSPRAGLRVPFTL